jgi:hypothetical protein
LLLWLYRRPIDPIESCVHLFGGFEKGTALCREPHQGARTRIPALARGQRFHAKDSKPSRFNPLALSEGLGHALKDLADNVLCGLWGEPGVLTPECGYQVTACHAVSFPVQV